jgi:bifunctional non-homologous end joining protein LigD
MSNQVTRLTFEDGRSSKEYRVAIEPKDGGYVVNFAYGRIGSALKDGTKTASPVSLEAAEKIAQKLLNDKMKKGYQPDGENSTMPVESARGDIVFQCQLSNPVTETKLRELLHESDYLAQIKYDGERRPVFVENGEVTALNRTGRAVSVNPAFVAPLLEMADKAGGKLILDCEDMGETLRVFDVLFAFGEELKSKPFSYRVSVLDKLDIMTNSETVLFCETYRLNNCSALSMVLDFSKNSGQEGLIFRKANAIYEAGRPASLGTSLKLKFTNDLSALVKSIHSSKRSVNLVLLDANGTEVDMGNVTIPNNASIPAVGDVVDVNYLWALEGGKLIQPVFKRNRTGEIEPSACTMAQVVIKNPQDLALAS